MLRVDYYKANSKRISVDTFYEKFSSYWDNMGETFRKLESLQFYQEGPESAMHPFFDGNVPDFVKKLRDFKNADAESSAQVLSKGIKMKRLHLVSFPISQYIEFEYYSYYISNFLGEDIRFKKVDVPSLPIVCDFVVFDNKNMLMHDYNRAGQLVGAWECEDKNIINEVITVYDKWFNSGEDFKGIMAPDEKILKGIFKM